MLNLYLILILDNICLRTTGFFIISFFSCGFLGWGGGESRIKSIKSTKTYYVIRFSFFSLNDIESKFLYIDVLQPFYTDFLFGLLYFFCRSAYSDDWDIFTYTQEWPVAVCIKGKEEVNKSIRKFTDSKNYSLKQTIKFPSFLYFSVIQHHTCTIPPGVQGWGIHGMW